MSTKKEKLHALLLADIESGDDQRIIDGLSKIKVEGTAKLLPAMIKLWFNSSEEVMQEVMNLLYSLKDEEEVTPILLEQIAHAKNSEQRQKLISIFWNAGFEPKENLKLFVQYAIGGEFMETFECLTVIENMEPPFPEDGIMESMILLKEYFAQKPTGEKVDLIRSIATIIQFRDETQNDI